MCGRYYTEVEREELENIVNAVRDMFPQQEAREILDKMKTGKIYPTDIAPVYVRSENGPAPTLMKWGFPGFPKKNAKAKPPVIINARSETVAKLLLFRSCLHQRCLVPATCYYEFSQHEVTPDRKKLAYEFRPQDETITRIWMAAIYRHTEDAGVPVFTILTMDAPDSMKHIHPRMPVILGGKRARSLWMQGGDDLSGLFRHGALTDIRFKPAS